MSRSLVGRVLVVVGAVLLLSKCGLFSLDEKSNDVRELIQRNMENWEEENIEAYRFTYNKTIGGTEQDSVQVTVLGGQIDSVSVGEEGIENPDSDAFLTVDRLFDEIIKNFERDDRGQFRVQFDEELSYPKRYRMAPGEETKGRGVVVTSFTPLEEPNSNAGPQRVAVRETRE